MEIKMTENYYQYQLPQFFVWENDSGTIDVAESEHGHYASVCWGSFDTREEAEKFVNTIRLDEKDSL